MMGLVARKGAGAAVKVRRGELSRSEARSALRGVKVSALPPRKRSASKPTPAKPTPAAKPKPRPTPRRSTAAKRAATRRRNARRAAGY
jgi:hypothetical protein